MKSNQAARGFGSGSGMGFAAVRERVRQTSVLLAHCVNSC
jgi:hypothetical protein